VMFKRRQRRSRAKAASGTSPQISIRMLLV